MVHRDIRAYNKFTNFISLFSLTLSTRPFLRLTCFFLPLYPSLSHLSRPSWFGNTFFPAWDQNEIICPNTPNKLFTREIEALYVRVNDVTTIVPLCRRAQVALYNLSVCVAYPLYRLSFLVFLFHFFHFVPFPFSVFSLLLPPSFSFLFLRHQFTFVHDLDGLYSRIVEFIEYHRKYSPRYLFILFFNSCIQDLFYNSVLFCIPLYLF
jgi:hypothetical protein